jgi:hypothetical protein
MSAELNAILSTISFIKGKVSYSFNPGPRIINVNGTHMVADVGIAATSNGIVPKGSIGTIGWVWLENTDATNILNIGGDGTTYPFSLKPGEGAWFRMNAANLQCKSLVAPVGYFYVMIED